MASNLNPQQKRRIFCVVAVIGIAIVTILDGGSSLPSILDESARESRLLRPSQSRRDPVYRWARNNLKPLSKPPNHKTETSVFWHIPKSGGSTAEKIYECLGQSLANRVGALPQFGHANDKVLTAFKPWDVHGIDATYVNVDTSTPEGIIHAAAMGLVPSHMADIIFTGDPNFAVEHLFDEKTKGRVYVLFRHPIDRLVSKFYYLQTATWERTYAPSWKNLSILEWAKSHNRDQDIIVKKLAGKRLADPATERDLRMAMVTMRTRFIVGLMDEMEESIHRFNTAMGIDESTEQNQKCMIHFFGDHKIKNQDQYKRNSHEHPKVVEGTPEWNILAERNSYDLRLYDYILKLFDEQKELIDSYARSRS